MSFIINSLSHVLGFLMDIFFRCLTFVGYPRLWACIVLFAFVTRLIFLRQKISSCKSAVLAPVIKKELLAVDPDFYEKTKNKELTIARAALKKKVYKKYKLSSGSGCLTLLIQYPILVALFSVVNNPQKFVPSLETTAGVNPQVNSFLGLSLSDVPLNNFSLNSFTSCLFMLVPVIIIVSNVIKFWPSMKALQEPAQKRIGYFLYSVLFLLFGWLSAKLPIVISLYWLASDIANSILKFVIHIFLSKSKTISEILAQHESETENPEVWECEEAVVEDDTEEVSSADDAGTTSEECENEIVENEVLIRSDKDTVEAQNTAVDYGGAQQAIVNEEDVNNALRVTEEG